VTFIKIKRIENVDKIHFIEKVTAKRGKHNKNVDSFHFMGNVVNVEQNISILNFHFNGILFFYKKIVTSKGWVEIGI